MKKLALFIIIIFVLLSMDHAAYAFDLSTPTPPPSDSNEIPTSFSAALLFGVDDYTSMGEVYFEFEDKIPTQSHIDFYILTDDGDEVHIERDYALVYSKDSYLAGSPIIITGTFTETRTGGTQTLTAKGHVEGLLTQYNNSGQTLIADGDYLIMLIHYIDSYDGEASDRPFLVFFLEPPEGLSNQELTTPDLSQSTTPDPTPTMISATPTKDLPFSNKETSSLGGEDHHHSSSSSSGSSSSKKYNADEPPETSGPAQVAVGAVLVSLLVALSNISVSAAGGGMSGFSMSGNFGSASQGTSQNIISSASQANEIINATPSDGTLSFKEAAKQAFTFIKDFIKQLIANLRDMLTDEGRAYASGKLSDILDDGEE